VGSLVVLAIAGGWGWRELQAAPAVALPAEPDTLDPDVLSFLEGKVEATRSDPRSPETRADMGLAYMGNRLWNEARHEFEVAALLEPDEPLWRLHSAICIYNEGEMEASLETYEALETELPASPALLWRLGERLFDANRTDEALERFERLIEIAPMLPEGYLGRGKIQNQRGEYARAVEDLERAVRLDRDYRTAYYQLGLAYRGVGDKRARAAMLRGRNSKPRYLPTDLDARLREYAVGYNRELDKAERLFEEGEPQPATGILESFRRRRPNDVNVLVRLARLHRIQGELEKARVHLKRALEVDADDLPARLELVRTLLASGAPAKALEEADAAIERAPDAAAPVLAKAEVLLAMRQPKKADALLEGLVRRYPRDLDVRVQLCQLNLTAGRKEVASRWLKEARDLAPGDERLPTLTQALQRL